MWRLRQIPNRLLETPPPPNHTSYNTLQVWQNPISTLITGVRAPHFLRNLPMCRHLNLIWVWENLPLTPPTLFFLITVHVWCMCVCACLHACVHVHVLWLQVHVFWRSIKGSGDTYGCCSSPSTCLRHSSCSLPLCLPSWLAHELLPSTSWD